MNDVDKLVRDRVRMLMFAAFSFGLWQFASVLENILQTSQEGMAHLFIGLKMIGGLCWIIASYFIFAFSRKVKRANAIDPLNDELTEKNRAKAFSVGFTCLFILVWLLYLATDLWSFNIALALQVVGTLGVIIPISYFAALELKNDWGAN